MSSWTVLLMCLGLMVLPLGVRSAFSQPQPLSPFARQKARTLLREQLSCLGCHRLDGEGGVIAPALDSVWVRRDAAYIAAMITNPDRVRPGAAMPSTRIPMRQRELIIRYLGGDPAKSDAAPASFIADKSVNAPALYQKWCAGCHGQSGKGDAPNAKSLPVAPAQHANASVMSRRSDDALFDAIYGGGAIMNRSARMPAFGASLSTAQIRALVQHIRSLCACTGPAWSRDGAR